MKTAESIAILIALALSFVGLMAFIEGVFRPWCDAYLKRCEDERRKNGQREPERYNDQSPQ